MGFLKDLISGHEAFFAASDIEKGWGASNEASASESSEEESKSE